MSVKEKATMESARLKEIEALRQTAEREISSLQNKQAAFARARSESTAHHLQKLELERGRAAQLIQIREKEIEAARKRAEVEAAVAEANHCVALVQLAEDERAKKNELLKLEEIKHQRHIEELERHINKLQSDKEHLQDELEKCIIS